MTEKNVQPHGIYVALDDFSEEPQQMIAWVKPAANEDVNKLIAAPISNDGRSPWSWVRLIDGTLMLGIFPKGDTYMEFSDAGVCDLGDKDVVDPVQRELESYSPLGGKPMSQALRNRLISETDPERLREGMCDSDLWIAWLRS